MKKLTNIKKHGKMSNKVLLSIKPIAVYGISNNTAVLVYDIGQYNDNVLAGYNNVLPEQCEITEQYNDDTNDIETGFIYGNMFVPFSECVRTTSY